MASTVTILGEPPFAKDANGKLKSRIGTIFPRTKVLVTLPGIHATQRRAYIDHLNAERVKIGRKPLDEEKESHEWNSAVDLIFDENAIQIRADPHDMPLAFEADELLQEFAPIHRVSFLGILNEKIRTAIKKRGEWWRITPLPKSLIDMERMIDESRIALDESEIFYYSKITGTRYLTCQKFAELADLDDDALRRQLLEIQQTSVQRNAHGSSEIAFFAVERAFSHADFAGCDFLHMSDKALRAAFHELHRRFFLAVEPELRRDDVKQAEWRNGIIAALLGQDREQISEETLFGLSPEFFMQIEWLPGACIEEGELVLDLCPVPENAEADEDLLRLFDEKPRQFIFNFVREYGNLEYINIGRVVGSLSHRKVFYGRRGVYVAVLKHRESEQEMVSIIRLQKRGVHEFLEEGYSLVDAMLRSEDYTERILDRRLACKQLGMNLPHRVSARKVGEQYTLPEGRTVTIWTPYFERDYIRGFATDKVPPCRFENPEFAFAFARLLGRAAATNMIVGRFDLAGHPLFDDGDEILIEDSQGMPIEIVVADHTGTFNDDSRDLASVAPEYADPVVRRADYLPDVARFTEVYLEAFIERFSHIREEYRRRKRAFDTLFRHRSRDEEDCFAIRWENVLARLDDTDPLHLARLIRDSIIHQNEVACPIS